ncbi:50S ribosomal protein L18 [Acaryochloris marina]|uniref:Large ribosomal subunit protein uL18 n=1 Tax=Acaryochloris marina (strain MBIC 11017) TaxID=329726 RepID=RL18_ACAM1|nr:50S ribosomal protein L18 [Acaryochloris marina]B0C1E8.1 RecName: Full=Large ribosomal subunit protein uL18; AltName: Full=50S ribosomal protein L18 [Acaryochloris marina MBIC11017]ABW29683.1 50S ribosomal protein L18 [Acaryochloris marina MBIC11017]BDM78582.1 50S ribosomal protein L18 [Acaryochloris marina MBIC10699]
MKTTRRDATRSRHQRVRRKVVGTAERPRLAVFRSNQHIYAQVIDDAQQHTLAAASTVESDLKSSSGATCDASTAVGKLVAERAIEKGIKAVVFDRGGNLYHGRVKALADAAREAGLEF